MTTRLSAERRPGVPKYDFAFPSSSPAADRIQQQRHITAKYAPFSSPMVIATFHPIADLLAKEGAAKHGAVWTFDVSRYLGLVALPRPQQGIGRRLLARRHRRPGETAER